MFLRFLAAVLFLASMSSLSSATDSFVFGGCSQVKFLPNSPYELNVNSILTSLVNSAAYTSYNNFTSDTVSGLFQCRGDLGPGDCSRCVARAVSQLGTLCLDSCGGALQLDGCFVKYDNASFLGVEDKTELANKCGPSTTGYGPDRRDAVLDYLGATDGSYKPFRVGGSGNLQAVAQCVGDLSPAQCQDCLSSAIGRLKTECPASAWGDMYLAKCYARYSEGGSHSRAGGKGSGDDNNDNEIEKTLSILVGLIAGVALIIIFLSFLRKVCEKAGKGGK